MKKTVLVILAALFCFLPAFATSPAFASGWIRQGDKWQYENPEGNRIRGWLQDRGNWYYMDESGNMKTGWIQYNGNWYYLEHGFGVNQGKMLTGWQWINSKCYYLDAARGGAMTAGGRTPDGYLVNAEGAWVDITGAEYRLRKGEDRIAYDVSDNQKDTDEQMRREVIDIVNEERSNAGLSYLETDESLSKAAQLRAEELTKKFSHTRPNGSSCFTAIKSDAFGSKGENIAMGQTDASAVMISWMDSAGHRENILNPSFTHIGVGCYTYEGRKHWVQLFGGTY